MYSRIAKKRKRVFFLLSLSMIFTVLASVIIVFNIKNLRTTNFATEAKAEAIEKTVSKTEKSLTQDNKLSQTTTETVVSEVPEIVQEQEENVQQVVTATPVVTTVAYSTPSAVLTNGNTAGEIGTSAAAQMAAATGVSQTVWEQIIARESNGNPYVSNGSGASGLFQTMPGWGSTATVQDQINSAINAYNAQGLSAWGY